MRNSCMRVGKMNCIINDREFRFIPNALSVMSAKGAYFLLVKQTYGLNFENR